MLSRIIGGLMIVLTNFAEIRSAAESRNESIEMHYQKKKMVLTPIDDKDLWSILVESHVNIMDKKPKEKLMIGAWAHIMLENANGRRVWNNNLGNIGNLPSMPTAKYYSHFGKAKYRSFDSVIAGAEAYWVMLYRCPMAIKYFESGNVEAASLSLKRCNYYRSEEEVYSRTLAMLYERGSKISRARKSSR